MTPNNEEDLYASCGFLVNENSIGWYNESYHSKHMNYFKLIGEISKCSNDFIHIIRSRRVFEMEMGR